MAKDSKSKSATSISKEEEKKMKNLAKEEKMKKKLLEKEEKRRSKEEKKMKMKEDERRIKEERKKMNSKTDIHTKKKSKSSDAKNITETQSQHSEVKSVRSAYKTGEQSFQFRDSRFVMPRGRKGYIFPVTPGPARYPVTRINYPIMNARRQVDLTKKMFTGPSIPAFTMGIRHSELREFYNKIQ